MNSPVVIAGQMRTGTTWLWEALRSSPQIWVPPLKELRLLNAMDDLDAPTCFQRLTAQQPPGKDGDEAQRWYDRTWRHYIKAALSQMTYWMEKDFGNTPFGPIQAREFEFWTIYLSRVHDLELYNDLARLAEPRRMLDASPNYLTCREDVLVNFARRFPAAQIVVMMRDPFDQFISFTKWSFPDDAIKRCADASTIRDWLRQPQIIQDFNLITGRAAQLRKAIRAFGAERIFLSTMDDVARQPRALIASLASFLDVDIPWFPPAAVNPSVTEDVSPAFVEVALEMALGEAEQLIDIIPAAATAWRDRIRTMMAGGTPEREVAGLWSGPLDKLSVP